MTPTDLVKQVASRGELKKHVDSRYIVVLILEFNDNGADEFEDVAVFQGCVDLHFLVNCFAFLVCGFVSDVDEFACCDSMVVDVNGLEHAMMV